MQPSNPLLSCWHFVVVLRFNRTNWRIFGCLARYIQHSPEYCLDTTSCQQCLRAGCWKVDVERGPSYLPIWRTFRCSTAKTDWQRQLGIKKMWQGWVATLKGLGLVSFFSAWLLHGSSCMKDPRKNEKLHEMFKSLLWVNLGSHVVLFLTKNQTQ